MSISITKKDHGCLKKEVVVISKKETTNNTDTVAHTIPIAENTSAFVQVVFIATEGNDEVSGGNTQAVFKRKTGNVTRTDATSSGLLEWIKGSFLLTQPKIDIKANGTDVDVVMKGLSSTNIDWHFEVTIYTTN